jgi:proteasome alpha subunit
MSMPFYVSPEQLMKDRADFARKGIARGRSLVVVQYVDGIVFVSENLSQALHKVSEIYDRIAFAAVGRYNEFENLRIAGVRLADMRGYAYDRRDVTGRGLANAYAQTLGTIFSSGGEKPYEVEIFVAEVGDSAEGDQIYRLTYDGQVADEHGFAAMGGSAEQVTTYLKDRYQAGVGLDEAIRLAVQGLGQGATEARTIPSANLEVAVLDRTRSQQRKFKRLTAGQLGRILGNGGSSEPPGGDDSGGGPSTDPSGPDDPADPTDTASGVPPLEDPVTGEPNGHDDAPVAPPVS